MHLLLPGVLLQCAADMQPSSNSIYEFCCLRAIYCAVVASDFYTQVLEEGPASLRQRVEDQQQQQQAASQPLPLHRGNVLARLPLYVSTDMLQLCSHLLPKLLQLWHSQLQQRPTSYVRDSSSSARDVVEACAREMHLAAAADALLCFTSPTAFHRCRHATTMMAVTRRGSMRLLQPPLLGSSAPCLRACGACSWLQHCLAPAAASEPRRSLC